MVLILVLSVINTNENFSSGVGFGPDEQLQSIPEAIIK